MISKGKKNQYAGSLFDSSGGLRLLMSFAEDLLRIIYGLQAEHTMEDQVVWTGEAGKVFFYQNELPYINPRFRTPGKRNLFFVPFLWCLQVVSLVFAVAVVFFLFLFVLVFVLLFIPEFAFVHVLVMNYC